MNYIKHLSAFLGKVRIDNRLSPNHVSLYLALFHYWNISMFENPLSVNRTQILELSKIGSQHTYYKCLRELHSFGYIRYAPSHNPAMGCRVYLCNFDITDEVTSAKMHNLDCKNDTTIAAEMHKYDCKNDITIAAKMQPSINNINNKTYCGETTQTQNSDLTDSELEKEINDMSEKAQTKKIETEGRNLNKNRIAPKKVEVQNQNPAKVYEKEKIPPLLNQVKTFFKKENFPDLEAQKFFNHFQSNGWKVGGKSPMKDWHAAARNWMLNAQNFTNSNKPNSTNLNTNKRYDIPL